jgi:hypothetical protein
MSHSDEDEPERLDFLLRKGEENRQWICQKYNIKDPFSGGKGKSKGTKA